MANQFLFSDVWFITVIVYRAGAVIIDIFCKASILQFLDIPPSPQDVLGLLLEASNPSNELCTFVSTVTRKILLFRTESTPSLTLEQAQAFCAAWRLEINRRYRRPFFSRKTDYELQQETQEILLDEKARELHLAIFVAPAEESIAERVRTARASSTSFR